MGMLLIEMIEHATGYSCTKMARELGRTGDGAVTRYLSMRKAKKIALTDLVKLYNIAHRELGWSLSDFWAQVEAEAGAKPQKRK